MSLTRKLTAAGLPVAGAAVLAALALTGQPASAAPAETAHAGAALVAPLARQECDTAATCDDTRGTAGYYGDDDNGGTGNGDGPTRGNDGYGGTDNVPTPSPDVPTPGGEGPDTPGGGPDTPGTNTPGGGVSPDEVPGEGNGAGAGDGDVLPLTGSPIATAGIVGALLVGAGLAARLAVRRRRA